MIEILYDDKDIVACVKPEGLSSEDGLPKALTQQLKSEIFTVHRLDTPVCGVMVYAKNKGAAAILSKKIAQHSDFEKTYLLICEGEFCENEGVMKDFLFKDSRKNKSFVVKRERKGVKRAVLQYKVLAKGEYNNKVCSLVSVILETGRSHQIRVQFASRKHPLLGDGKYGSDINCPIALLSHKIRTDGKTFLKNPPDKRPWNIFVNI